MIARLRSVRHRNLALRARPACAGRPSRVVSDHERWADAQLRFPVMAPSCADTQHSALAWKLSSARSHHGLACDRAQIRTLARIGFADRRSRAGDTNRSLRQHTCRCPSSQASSSRRNLQRPHRIDFPVRARTDSRTDAARAPCGAPTSTGAPARLHTFNGNLNCHAR